MTSLSLIVTWLLVAIAAVLVLSTIGLVVLAIEAARGNPRVVADEAAGQRLWERDESWLEDYDSFGIVTDVVAEAESYTRRAAR